MVVRFFEKKEQAGTWIREKKEQVKEEVEKKGVACSFFLCMVVRFFRKKEQARGGLG